MSSTSEALIEKAWPKIEAAVKTGLAEPKAAALSAVVAVPTRSADLAGHVRFKWGERFGSTLKSRRLWVAVDNVVELSAVKSFPLSSLDPEFGSTDAVTKWATDTRANERRWVIDRIARQGTMTAATLDAAELKKAAAVIAATSPNGVRLVAFTKVDHLADHCEALDIEFVDAAVPAWPAGFGAAVVYACDKFAASRLEEFTPSWEVDGDKFELSLTERVELIGFDPCPQIDVVRFMTAGTFAKL